MLIPGVTNIGSWVRVTLQRLQHTPLNLQVPGVIDLTGLDSGTCRARRVTAAFHVDRLEERFVGSRKVSLIEYWT